MSAKDELKAAYDKLAAEIAAVDAQAAPLIAEGRRINAELQPLLAKQRELTAKLKPLRDSDYAEKKKLLASLAVALGGKRLVAEAG